MLYEVPLLAYGLAGHAWAVSKVPALKALPLPAQVGLVVLPTALMTAQSTVLQERLSPRSLTALGLLAGTAHLGLSLSPPASLLWHALRSPVPLWKLGAALGFTLAALLPSLLLAGLYLASEVRDWREAPPDTP
ncbi:hypothetical protein P2318_30430 [Myxococcaceae bacterium GXIMD 01537]